jgi:acetyl esterase
MTVIRPARVEVEDLSLASPHRPMVRIFRAEEAPRPAPVILCPSAAAIGTPEHDRHDRLARTLAADTAAAVLVPRPEPEPSDAVESLYDILSWIAHHGRRRWLDATRIALAGEGPGADLCDRLTLLTRDRNFHPIRAGALLWSPDDDPAPWHHAARFLRAALDGATTPCGDEQLLGTGRDQVPVRRDIR